MSVENTTWSEKEVEILKSGYAFKGSDIDKLKHRSEQAIRDKAYKLGLEYESPERKKITCDNCGNEASRWQSNLRSEKTFCSNDCQYDYLSSENHPKWDEEYGKTRYNREWDAARKKRLKKDDHKCTECGVNRETHIQAHGVDLHVHHVIPLKEFSKPEEAHRISNLETLCASCHLSKENKTRYKQKY